MVLKKLLAAYSVIIAVMMTGMWITFLATGQIPEITTQPVSLAYHLLAEFTTAILLIVSGFGLLRSKKWAININRIALGMLLYTVLASPGYYAQQGNMVLVWMFAVLTVLTVIGIIISFRIK